MYKPILTKAPFLQVFIEVILVLFCLLCSATVQNRISSEGKVQSFNHVTSPNGPRTNQVMQLQLYLKLLKEIDLK